MLRKFDTSNRLTARNLATDTARNAAVTYYGVGSDSRTTNLVKNYHNGVTDYGYYYDANGQITSVNEGAVVQSFGYDALGQMTYESNRRTNTNTHYMYDNGGNLLQKTIYPSFTSQSGTPTVITYEYANTAWADQLTKYNGEYSVCNNRFCFAARFCGSHNRVAAQPSVLAVSAPGGARYSVPTMCRATR